MTEWGGMELDKPAPTGQPACPGSQGTLGIGGLGQTKGAVPAPKGIRYSNSCLKVTHECGGLGHYADFLKAWQVTGWPQTPCRIQSSLSLGTLLS